MNGIEQLVTPGPAPAGQEGLATPLLGLIVLGAVILWALRAGRRSRFDDDE